MDIYTAKINLSFADVNDREKIYELRHQVYARELGQHSENESGKLSDKLDAVNCYIVAKIAGLIVGFVAITPPNTLGYSIDKYFSRDEVPLSFDNGLFEIRLLTVTGERRGSHIGASLYYGALCYVESLKGKTLVAIGRLEVLDMYLQVGMHSLGRQVKSGKVIYELLCAEMHTLKTNLRAQNLFAHLEKRVDWQMNSVNFLNPPACYHGGMFFEAIGDEFDKLERKDEVINADVLDAWFDPAPAVSEAIASHLSWTVKTSPPTDSGGMQRMIAKSRGVKFNNILPGAGSSTLIFLALREWLNPSSRVLILDPMYGEYAHVLENIIGCRVDRYVLSRKDSYRVDLSKLEAYFQLKYDWVILVNPNSPTGQHVPKEALWSAIQSAPKTIRFWIDETYIDFLDPLQSLELLAVDSPNVVICKSMSKAFALSGARCAYLCGNEALLDQIRRISPPWAVSLPAQIAACEALRNISYYQDRWIETDKLRSELSIRLSMLGWEIIPGSANFLLCHIPACQPTASSLISACRKYNLFLRDVANMGQCFDDRTLRIAVKDRRTNQSMLSIIKKVLAKNTDL